MTQKNVILKIGGAALRDYRDFEQVARHVSARATEKSALAIVLSAPFGVTDELLAAWHNGTEPDTTVSLFGGGDTTGMSRASMHNELNIARRVGHDAFVALGEQWSARLFADLLRSNTMREVVLLDPRTFIEVGADGAPHYAIARADGLLLRRSVRNWRTTIFVVPGFFGREMSHSTRTIKLMARNGSDLTTLMLADLLNETLGKSGAKIGTIKKVTATAGIRTVDPAYESLCPAKTVEVMTAAEMREAVFSSPIAHSGMMRGCSDRTIELWITSVDGVGTRIIPTDTLPDGCTRGPIATIAVVPLTAVTVSARGASDAPGLIVGLHDALFTLGANTFTTVAGADDHTAFLFSGPQKGVSRTLFAPDTKQRTHDVEVVRETTSKWLRKAGCTSEVHIDIKYDAYSGVVLVGTMEGKVGTLARAATALSEANINVCAVNQAVSERAITFIVRREDIATAVRVLHTLFLEP